MVREAIAIRPARPEDASGISSVEVDTWRDAYPTLVPAAYLVRRLDARLGAERWRRRIGGRGEAVIVAEADEAGQPIVGYATWGPPRVTIAAAAKASQLYELYVAPAAREHGVGRRLVRAAAERALGAGMASLLVEVLAANPARWFYEALGARLAAQGRHAFAGRRLASVVYAWDDLTTLAGAATG